MPRKFISIASKIKGKISAGFAKIRALRSRPGFAKQANKAQPAALVQGHRGVAQISTKMRMERIARGEQPFSAEEIAKWHMLPGEEVYAFVHEQWPLFVHSSNVVMAQYFHADRKLLIEFKTGKAYLYSEVSEHEAIEFAKSPSKGVWCWDYLRIRGTKNGHRKPYVRVSGGITVRKPSTKNPTDVTMQQLLAMDPASQQQAVRLTDDEIIRLLNEEMRRQGLG